MRDYHQTTLNVCLTKGALQSRRMEILVCYSFWLKIFQEAQPLLNRSQQ